MKEVAGGRDIMRDYKITLTPQAIEEYAAAHSAPESELLAELARETYAKMKDPRVEAILCTIRDGITLAWKRS